MGTETEVGVVFLGPSRLLRLGSINLPKLRTHSDACHIDII